MKLKHSIKLNIISGWMTHALALVVGVLLMPFILRTLGDEQYGTWLFINAFAGYGALLNLGLGRTIGCYVSRFHEEENWDALNRIVNFIFFLYCLLGAIVITAAGVLAWLAPNLRSWHPYDLTEVRAVFIILGINLAVQIVGSTFGGVVVGLQRFDMEGLFAAFVWLLKVALTFCFLNAEHGLLIMALITLALSLAENGADTVYALRKIPFLRISWRFVNWSTFVEFRSFSGYALLNDIGHRILYETDAIIIGCVLGTAAIVPYTIASRLTMFLVKPIQHIGRVSMPRAGQLQVAKDHTRLSQLVQRMIGFSFVLILGAFIGVSYFGADLIEVWVGREWRSSHQLLMILLGAQLIVLPATILRSILFGLGHARLPAMLYFAEAICNVVLTLVLIQPYGLLGVALGTAIPTAFFELTVLYPFARRLIGFDGAQLIRRALGPPVVPAALLLAFCLAVSSAGGITPSWTMLAVIAVTGGGLMLGTWHLANRKLQFYSSNRLSQS